jgi:hypothetical protein
VIVPVRRKRAAERRVRVMECEGEIVPRITPLKEQDERSVILSLRRKSR